MKKNRLLVIGWDGAEYSLVTQFLKQGRLPNLTKLVNDGYLSGLESTIRPESSVAWTTFATGVNPGVHGIYGFSRPVNGNYSTELVNSSHVKAPFFWEILSLQDKRVAILNMPMAYPPRPVNGWFVSGLMTPGKDVIYTYPADLSARLNTLNYPIDADTGHSDESREAFAQRMLDQVYRRTQIAKELLQDQSWDFASVIYTELDRVQHFFWADMEPSHALYPKHPLSNVIPEHYVSLDQMLGELAEMAGQNTSIILLSDHGFGPCERNFYVNGWLLQRGWLKLLSSPFNLKSTGASIVAKAKQNRFIRQVKRMIANDWSILKPLQKNSFYSQIDWANTRAWFDDTGGIRINVYGEQPYGIVRPGGEYDQLVNKIRNDIVDLLDPETHLPIVGQAYLRAEIYQGPEYKHAPDIIIDTYRGTMAAPPRFRAVSINHSDPTTIFGSSEPYTGEHRYSGMCASNRLPPFKVESLIDITKWVFNNLDCVLDQEFSNYATESFNAEDEERIRERLRNLGYMD